MENTNTSSCIYNIATVFCNDVIPQSSCYNRRITAAQQQQQYNNHTDDVSINQNHNGPALPRKYNNNIFNNNNNHHRHHDVGPSPGLLSHKDASGSTTPTTILFDRSGSGGEQSFQYGRRLHGDIWNSPAEERAYCGDGQDGQTTGSSNEDLAAAAALRMVVSASHDGQEEEHDDFEKLMTSKSNTTTCGYSMGSDGTPDSLDPLRPKNLQQQNYFNRTGGSTNPQQQYRITNRRRSCRGRGHNGIYHNSNSRVVTSQNMNAEELNLFRTQICPRKTQDDSCTLEECCPYSHCLSWHRRNPQLTGYRPGLCPNVVFSTGPNKKMKVRNYCRRGRLCLYSHTKEEQMYHPLVYKTHVCRDWPHCNKHFCPFAHGPEELRSPQQIDFHLALGPEKPEPPMELHRASLAAAAGGSPDGIIFGRKLKAGSTGMLARDNYKGEQRKQQHNTLSSQQHNYHSYVRNRDEGDEEEVQTRSRDHMSLPTILQHQPTKVSGDENNFASRSNRFSPARQFEKQSTSLTAAAQEWMMLSKDLNYTDMLISASAPVGPTCDGGGGSSNSSNKSNDKSSIVTGPQSGWDFISRTTVPTSRSQMMMMMSRNRPYFCVQSQDPELKYSSNDTLVPQHSSLSQSTTSTEQHRYDNFNKQTNKQSLEFSPSSLDFQQENSSDISTAEARYSSHHAPAVAALNKVDQQSVDGQQQQNDGLSGLNEELLNIVAAGMALLMQQGNSSCPSSIIPDVPAEEQFGAAPPTATGGLYSIFEDKRHICPVDTIRPPSDYQKASSSCSTAKSTLCQALDFLQSQGGSAVSSTQQPPDTILDDGNIRHLTPLQYNTCGPGTAQSRSAAAAAFSPSTMPPPDRQLGCFPYDLLYSEPHYISECVDKFISEVKGTDRHFSKTDYMSNDTVGVLSSDTTGVMSNNAMMFTPSAMIALTGTPYEEVVNGLAGGVCREFSSGIHGGEFSPEVPRRQSFFYSAADSLEQSSLLKRTPKNSSCTTIGASASSVSEEESSSLHSWEFSSTDTNRRLFNNNNNNELQQHGWSLGYGTNRINLLQQHSSAPDLTKLSSLDDMHRSTSSSLFDDLYSNPSVNQRSSTTSFGSLSYEHHEGGGGSGGGGGGGSNNGMLMQPNHNALREDEDFPGCEADDATSSLNKLLMTNEGVLINDCPSSSTTGITLDQRGFLLSQICDGISQRMLHPSLQETQDDDVSSLYGTCSVTLRSSSAISNYTATSSP